MVASTKLSLYLVLLEKRKTNERLLSVGKLKIVEKVKIDL